MYESLYQLHTDPFRLAPDPRFCYEHDRFRKGRAYMKYALSQGDGILMITGHPGTGKTMLIEHFLCALDRSSLLTATLLNTQVEEDDLFRMVGFGFGMNVRNLDRATILYDLQDFLTTKRRAGHRALLIVDEAQNLSAPALEQLRMLTNLRDRTEPLLQLFLVGQKQLIDLVHTPAMEPLYQRLIAASHLEPLQLEETVAYIQHRLRCAGWRGDPHFTKEIRVLIHRFSGGYPRLINKICGRVLLYGSVSGKHRLDAEDFFSALDQVQDEYLMPGNEVRGIGITPDLMEIMNTRSDDTDWKQHLTQEEKTFLEKPEAPEKPQPAETPAPSVKSAPPPPDRVPAETIATALRNTPDVVQQNDPQSEREPVSTSTGRPAADQHTGQPESPEPKRVKPIQQPAAQTTPLHRPARPARKRNYSWVNLAASVIVLISVLVYLGNSSRNDAALNPVAESETIALAKPSKPAVAAESTPAPFTRETVREEPVAEARETVEEQPAIAATVPEEAPPEPIEVASINPVHKDSAFATVTSDVTPVYATENNSPPSNNRDAENPDDGAIAPEAPVPDENPVASNRESGDDAPGSPPAEPERDAVDTRNIVHEEPVKKIIVVKKTSRPDHDSVQREAEREIKRLLVSARDAYRKDYLTTPPGISAYRYLQQVLDQDPGNEAAIRGLGEIVKRYGVLAEAALRKQEYDRVQTLTTRGLNIEPDDRELQILQAKAQLLQEEALAQQEIEPYPEIVEPYEQIPGARPNDDLFRTIRSFFNDFIPDDVSTNEFNE